MSERIVLDPAEIVTTPSRTELDLHSGPIQVLDEGPSWGDAAIESHMAEGEYGATQVDFTVPNRVVEIPLVVHGEAGTDFDRARRALQQKVALLQREGGILKREITGGFALYLDVVRASLRMGGSTLQTTETGVDPAAFLTLETLPDWYGPEVLLGSGTISGGGVVRLASVPGDYPARMRAVISNTSGFDQQTLLYAIRSQVSDPTAGMDFEATTLTPLGGATRRTGFVSYAALPPTWISVLSTNISGVGPMTHVGPYRVYALAASSGTGAGTAQAKLEWKVGAMVSPAENGAVSLPASPAWVDLGQVQIERSPGTHQWEGRLLVNAPSGWSFSVYRLLVVPCTVAHGRVTAGLTTPTASAVTAWDAFTDHPDGNLAGNVAPVGGAWYARNTASVADPIKVTRSSGTGFAYRDNADPLTDLAQLMTPFRGQFALLPTRSQAVDLSGRVNVGTPPTPGGQPTSCGAALAARFVDPSNWLVGGLINYWSGGGMYRYAYVTKVVAGTLTVLIPGVLVAAGAWAGVHSLRLIVSTDGRCSFYVDGILQGSVTDSSLATGGPLASGDIGIADWATASTSPVGRRSYDNVFLSGTATAPDAVLFAGGTGELGTAGYFRSSAGRDVTSRLVPVGDLPRAPVGAAELYVRPARSMFGQPVPSPTVGDAARVDVYGSPCFLFTPDVT